jgi:hypothetical protein
MTVVQEEMLSLETKMKAELGRRSGLKLYTSTWLSNALP